MTSSTFLTYLCPCPMLIKLLSLSTNSVSSALTSVKCGLLFSYVSSLWPGAFYSPLSRLVCSLGCCWSLLFFLWLLMLNSLIFSCFQLCLLGLLCGPLLLAIYNCGFPRILSCLLQILTLHDSYTISQGCLIHTCSFNHNLYATTVFPMPLLTSVMASILSQVLAMMTLAENNRKPNLSWLQHKGSQFKKIA